MPVEPPADEGAEPEDPEKKDPYEQRLKPITSDAPVKDMKGAWVLKIKGDQAANVDARGQPVHYGVVVIRSLRWPGCYTCFKGGRWMQVYIGDGLKNEPKSYYPVFPPEVPTDPVDLEEQPEPTPLVDDAPPAEEEAKDPEAAPAE